MVEENDEIMSAWNDFYENVMKDMKNNIEYYRKFYENLSEKWTNFTNVVTNTITEGMKDNKEDLQELYNLWKNYQIKMNARIQRAYEVENERYKEIIKMWEDNGKKLLTIISGGRVEDDESIYLSWMDITTTMTRQINKAVADCNGEYKEMTKTWFEFLDKMREGISSLDKSNPRSVEVSKSMQDMLTAMSYEISNYINMCSKSAVNFQKNWMKMLTSARNIFSRLFPEINYEELYSGFFTRSALGGAYGAFVSGTKVRKLEEEVKDLRAKMKILEEQLKEKK